MADSIGRVVVPEIVPDGVFPIVPDFGYGMAISPEVAIHQFGSANAKVEQRYYLGSGAKRFIVRRAAMSEAERTALRDFWELMNGGYGAFTYNAPNDDGAGTTAYTVRFAVEPLTFEYLSDAVSSVGVTLVEIVSETPAYPLNSSLLRFPSEALETALLAQVQEIIPLINIQPRESSYPAIYVSDRRVTIGGQLYQARLVQFAGIEQTIGNESDEAQFVFGNADRVMRDLANDTDLFRASIEFSLYHVGSGIRLDLWKGEIINWSLDAGPEFRVAAADGIYELTLPYPTRRVSRTCWKCFNDGLGCRYAGFGSLDLAHYPSAVADSCDKGYDTANGCLAHRMKHYFGGVIAEPQGVRIKDNSQGTWGFGRPTVTSVSLVNDSIYDQVIPEVYSNNESYKDTNGDTKIGRLIDAKIAAGRDESDFYEALGIVCEGPVTFGDGHTLDNQFQHGPGLIGLRLIQGTDPAGATDYMSLDEAGTSTGGDFRKVLDGGRLYKDNFAAGLAALIIRRKDEKGLQLSYPGGHAMQAVIQLGLGGWVWTGPGARTWQAGLYNPVWIIVNMLLKARGLRYANAATAEAQFDVVAAVVAAAISELAVTPLVSREYKHWVQDPDDPEDPGHWEGGSLPAETQFVWQGVMQEEKPLRDWIQEVLMCCLGYYSFSFGKLRLGIRCNSSAAESFTEGNILWQSLQLEALRPAFNHITANFGDAEFNFAGNSVTVYDIDHAKLIGGATAPLFLKSQLNLSGVNFKSQAARIAATRLREELGGITPEQWARGRQLGFKTTILSLNVEPGMVCSLTHPDMPEGMWNGEPTANYGEFRVTGWKLLPDYSIEIQGRSTVDEMYDLTSGPKPADVAADPVPTEGLSLPGPPVGSRVAGKDGRFICDIGPAAWTGGLPICDILIQYADDEDFTENVTVLAGFGYARHQELYDPERECYFRFAYRNKSGIESDTDTKKAITDADPDNENAWEPDTGWSAFCAAVGPVESGTGGGGSPHVPDDLWTNAISNGLGLDMGCAADKWNVDIDGAEFRAQLFGVGFSDKSVDLRTPDEGGTLEHNGTDKWVVTGLKANKYGARFFIKAAQQGRLYFVFRLHNTKGWSVWSDGNDTPNVVTDFIDTEEQSIADTGPPADWAVEVIKGIADGTCRVRASRPKTNSHKILFAFFQIKDSTTGQWRDVSSDSGVAGSSDVLYDGSAISHTLDPATGELTIDEGGPADFGDGLAGGLLLMDARAGQFNEKYCLWNGIGSSQISGNKITDRFGIRLADDPDEDGKYHDVRIMIVKPPWEWTAEGYQGAQTGLGMYMGEYWRNGGDKATQTFESIDLPFDAAVNFNKLQGRVWFANAYSFSDDDTASPCPTDPPPGGNDPGVIIIRTDTHIVIDCNLGSIFYLYLTADAILDPLKNAKHCRPIILVVQQDGIGGHRLTLDDIYNTGIDIDDVALSGAPDGRDYFGFMHNADFDETDVVAFVRGY